MVGQSYSHQCSSEWLFRLSYSCLSTSLSWRKRWNNDWRARFRFQVICITRFVKNQDTQKYIAEMISGRKMSGWVSGCLFTFEGVHEKKTYARYRGNYKKLGSQLEYLWFFMKTNHFLRTCSWKTQCSCEKKILSRWWYAWTCTHASRNISSHYGVDAVFRTPK